MKRILPVIVTLASLVLVGLGILYIMRNATADQPYTLFNQGEASATFNALADGGQFIFANDRLPVTLLTVVVLTGLVVVMSRSFNKPSDVRYVNKIK